MSRKTQGNIFKRFAFVDKSLIAAVVDVFDHFEASGKRPGSEKWGMDDRFYRPEMCDAVCERWCEITGLDTYDFPYHHTIIARLWVSFRKETLERKAYTRNILLGYTWPS